MAAAAAAAAITYMSVYMSVPRPARRVLQSHQSEEASLFLLHTQNFGQYTVGMMDRLESIYTHIHTPISGCCHARHCQVHWQQFRVQCPRTQRRTTKEQDLNRKPFGHWTPTNPFTSCVSCLSWFWNKGHAVNLRHVFCKCFLATQVSNQIEFSMDQAMTITIRISHR